MIPLCERTRAMFAPVTSEWDQFHSDDRLSIGLTDDNNFIADPHCYTVDRTGQTCRAAAHYCMRQAVKRLPEQYALTKGMSTGFYNPIFLIVLRFLYLF